MGYASNPALAVDATGTAQMLWAVGGAQAWIAAVSTAPVGSEALIAWISGTSTQGTVRVSIGS